MDAGGEDAAQVSVDPLAMSAPSELLKRKIPASWNAHLPARCNPEHVGIRCLIVDDSKDFLDAASTLLEREGIEVVGVASTSAEALQRAEELEPDFVLVDINLGDESGFDLAPRLADNTHRAGSRVIMISTHPLDEFADLIEASPAIGFIPKSRLSAKAVNDLLSAGAS
jgi:two-component system, NarL family, nitrate/nitrite response regulator NarL